MPDVTRGMDFKLYLNTDDPYDNSPTWTEVTNVRDLSRKLEKALADASTRASTFRQQVGTLKDLTIEFGMVYNPSDTSQARFEEAFFTDEDLEILILDGPISTVGSKGLRMMATISQFGTDENLEDVGMVPVTIVPGYSTDNGPRRVEVTSPGSVVNVI